MSEPAAPNAEPKPAFRQRQANQDSTDGEQDGRKHGADDYVMRLDFHVRKY